MVYYMELSQGQIIQKPNKQELSSLFMTYRLIVMHAPVKFQHSHSRTAVRDSRRESAMCVQNCWYLCT